MFSHEQLHSILATLPDPAFILTRSGRYAALFGGIDTRYYHDGSNLVGQSMYDVLHLDKANWFSTQIAHALETRKLHIVEYALSGSDIKGLESAGPDEPIWFEGRIQALDFPVDGEDAVVWVASNITEKSAIQTRLRQLSETDDLTGLFNRRKLLEIIEERHDLFLRQRVPTAAFMFDVDNFKLINDELGHHTGDRVLSTISETCRATLRPSDILARLGGDEFVVLLPDMSLTDAEAITNLLRLRIGLDIKEKLAILTSISGGLSEFSHADQSGDDILRRADSGLYASKRNGRNRVSILLPDRGPSMRSAAGL